MRLKPQDLGAGWQARHNRNPKQGVLAGTAPARVLFPFYPKPRAKKYNPAQQRRCPVKYKPPRSWARGALEAGPAIERKRQYHDL
jgi:hypothetical protein